MTKLSPLLLAGVLLIGMPTAQAQTPPPPSDQTILHLSESAQRDMPRDLLHATLSAEATDSDATKVQGIINQRMAAALVRIKQVPDITTETAGYSVYRDNPDKKPPVWHGSQSVTVTGKDFAALLTLIGALQQQGLVMQNLSPDLSRDARQSVEDALTNEALTRLQQRADRVATTLGAKVAGIRSLTVGNVNPPAPVFRAMAMAPGISSSAVVPPVAEAGSAEVSVTVQAEIALAPK
jgi:predicted secreted protein